MNFFSYGQYTQHGDSIASVKVKKINYKAFIIPSALIGYGIIGLESHTLKDFNLQARKELSEHIDEQLTIDDFSQYTPFLSVYALNGFGVTGKHNFKDRTIVLVTSYLIMGGTVNLLKNASNVLRPDDTSKNSFPSGHTATAFMGAEFLWQEYKNVSVWYGIAGYSIAAGTGLFRMYNNRHWITDVAAGAGIGILSTKIAYLLHPWIKKTLFGNHESANACVLPFYNGKESGLGVTITF
ncbi:phosphatase PAP2 family protein [Abyssalbus ytuae]|uniref:Phosphatase PAP2 family protein n=1 Tax=Abyssalbus ytuae TaxID=2926907 RepID=A0A9E7CXZ8_9FLAO|nr:phosphatase PAP2 family protein [Abyssalbus ytuae]UOB16105.1 phosphatase PAP2 family protein [Abyssalbus ytuae]